ncbi:hypothetical protein DFH94DRAFT_688249 [Russula ochroleuca]|jgi:hypothetical protein|uniref:Uncharacterized protein n=1 Tax=Russula ochroleuca TaxID=152965 RepID=A0A9P5N4E1_9AGAM|nr:hypothetical protein DFH94DRAFT_688249 [Russula ochroleuca]
MDGTEWIGTLLLNTTCAQARARGNEAVGNPNLPAWPEHLQLVPRAISDPYHGDPYHDIVAWIREVNAPAVPLRCRDETDSRDFDRLVETLRSGSYYAVVKWGNGSQAKERLLLLPLNGGLLCAAFTEDGIPMRPTK